jgi:hypothetical protein
MEAPTGTKAICISVYIDMEHIVVKAIQYCYVFMDALEAHLVPTMARH